MNFKDAVVLVTGANRGLGKALAQAALAAGARKVYAGARKPEAVTYPGVTPIKLDATNAADVAAVVQAIPDLTILINNAGISTGSGATTPDALQAARDAEQQHRTRVREALIEGRADEAYMGPGNA